MCGEMKTNSFKGLCGSCIFVLGTLLFEHVISITVQKTRLAHCFFLHNYIPNNLNYVLCKIQDNDEHLSMANISFIGSYLFHDESRVS